MPSITILFIAAFLAVALCIAFIIPPAFQKRVYKNEEGKIPFSLLAGQEAHFITDRPAKVFLSSDKNFLTDISGELTLSVKMATFLHTCSADITGPGYISFISRTALEAEIEIATDDPEARVEISTSTGQKVAGVCATIVLCICFAVLVGLVFWKP